ncbi:hypothetical protein GYMLUDRAFT_248185 [Collybiopsis luxurians FD-317 M1]|uniref:Uncharacterized protein n=1 Tax=Collybiopsis luxurians FD-317 M1 TaxID=944289 RepID=A0A0D0BM83_9AGAR|nr:hypothetical protein GYMLUDRAFT_248185 [Collybiopsis luxurians FD-317 M1]
MSNGETIDSSSITFTSKSQPASNPFHATNPDSFTSTATTLTANSLGLVSSDLSSSSTSSSAAASTSNGNKKSSVVAVIAGSVVGSVAALAIITMTIIFLLRRRGRATSRAKQTVESTGNASSSTRQGKGSQPASSNCIPHLPESPLLLGDATDLTTMAPLDSAPVVATRSEPFPHSSTRSDTYHDSTFIREGVASSSTSDGPISESSPGQKRLSPPPPHLKYYYSTSNSSLSRNGHSPSIDSPPSAHSTEPHYAFHPSHSSLSATDYTISPYYVDPVDSMVNNSYSFDRTT